MYSENKGSVWFSFEYGKNSGSRFHACLTVAAAVLDEIMNDNMNSMTKLMYDYAKAGHLSLKEAKEKLHDNAYLRSVAETLAGYCDVSVGDTAALIDKVTGLLCKIDPSSKKDSVKRKVRNWINDLRGKSPISR